jgi:hypothetical protein
MLSSESIAHEIVRFHSSAPTQISAFWLETSGSRSDLILEINTLLGDLPIMVVSVPSGAFEDANGIIDDLSNVINSNRDWFTAKRNLAIERDSKFSLVLLSKRPLGIPQVSSPVPLPDWFPCWSGQLLTVVVKSVSNRLSVSLGSPDVPIRQLKAALFELDMALRDRLRSRFKIDTAPWTRFADRPAAGWRAADLAELVLRPLELQANGADDFRPSGGRESPYVVSLLFRLWCDCSHDNLHSLAVDFAGALGMLEASSVPLRFSLPSLLGRPFKPKLADTPRGVVFSRDAILISSQSLQLFNASSHSGDYPPFPAIVTISFVEHLAQACRDSALAIRDLGE